MTTKYITTYVAAGYTLTSAYSVLDITSTGGVGGTGVYAFSPATIDNYGVIVSSRSGRAGVQLFAGGNVFNAGDIRGDLGVYLSSGGTVANIGYVHAERYGVFVGSGGSVVNGDTGVIVSDRNGVAVVGAGSIANYGAIDAGSTSGAGASIGEGTVVNGRVDDTTALIGGDYGVAASGVGGGPATVMNYGTIRGTVFGVDLGNGGTVSNGGATDHDALVQGLSGISIGNAAGSVVNFGTIRGLAVGGAAISLATGGGVTNGGLGDRTALIEGGEGVVLSAAGAVINDGTIEGDTGAGVASHGGMVVNGDFGNTVATIQGYYGVRAYAGASVTNFGTIDGLSKSGVRLETGGAVTNGGAGDRGALIQGAYGVYAIGAAAAVSNFGTIRGTRGLSGVHLLAGGSVANGSLNNAKATIEGYDGLILSGPATAVNFATISGQGDAGGYGVSLGARDTLTNGAAGHSGALIEGFTGVEAYAGRATVTNFGTISGAGGAAVRFVVGGDVLVAEAGCAFQGAVLGGGGTLDLDTGTGTLTGLLSSGGDVTVSGSMATTTFQNFNTVEIGSAATFATSGAVLIAAGQSVVDAGRLTLGSGKSGFANAGVIEVTGGTLTVNGAVTGAGSAAVVGGTLAFTAAFNQGVKFSGPTGVLELAQSQSYSGAIAGFSKTGGTSLDLADIAFGGGTTATYSGTRSGGVLTVTDGTHTAHINLTGDYRHSTFVAASDGHGGIIIHDPTRPAASVPAASSPPAVQPFVAAMAGLGGAGAEAVGVANTLREPEPALMAPRTIAA
ncbi:MAG: beta strand repeat-containing protein [Caulobacteraceae bacterium]